MSVDLSLDSLGESFYSRDDFTTPLSRWYGLNLSYGDIPLLAFAEKRIAILIRKANGLEVQQSGWGEKLSKGWKSGWNKTCDIASDAWKSTCEVAQKTCEAVQEFWEDHKVEILVGAAICATGIGIAAVTGYTCSAVVGGVVVAGAGSIFSDEETPKQQIPAPSSKEEIALAQQSITNSLPKLELPSSITELLVTADGIWISGQFFSTQLLIQQPHFTEELNEWIAAHASDVPNQLPPTYLGNIASPSTEAPQNVVLPTPQETLPSMPMMNEPQPRRSQSFRIEGLQKQKCCIAWINGINNTLQESKESASYIHSLAGGLTVSGIYNCTHGPIVDVLEAAFLNHQGYSPNTAELLQNEWIKFHEENKDHPNAKLLQVCHSQGAIDVKNALTGSPIEIKNRVIVVAIAPAAVVPRHLCFHSYNYASENDFIYKLEPPPPPPVVALSIDSVIIPTFGDPMDYRGELILLQPHPEAEGIDHPFKSPTYQPVLFDIIEDYKGRQGQYLLVEKGKIE